jgi:hypothetical protein
LSTHSRDLHACGKTALFVGIASFGTNAGGWTVAAGFEVAGPSLSSVFIPMTVATIGVCDAVRSAGWLRRVACFGDRIDSYRDDIGHDGSDRRRAQTGASVRGPRLCAERSEHEPGFLFLDQLPAGRRGLAWLRQNAMGVPGADRVQGWSIGPPNDRYHAIATWTGRCVRHRSAT